MNLAFLMTNLFFNHSKMKEELLGALNQLEPESLDTLGVVLEAMSSVTNDVTELSSTAQVNSGLAELA